MNEEFTFDWAVSQFDRMEANPEHILSHLNVFVSGWAGSFRMAIDYLRKQMDESLTEEEREALPELESFTLGQIKISAMMWPAIVYYEDNPVTNEIHKALSLILYNLGLVLNDAELIDMYNVNSTVWEQKDTLKQLIAVANSVMIQHRSCQISNQTAEPYQLSVEFLKALVSSAKEEENNE